MKFISIKDRKNTIVYLEGMLRDHKFDFFGNIHIGDGVRYNRRCNRCQWKLCWNLSGIKHAIFYIKINQNVPWTSLSVRRKRNSHECLKWQLFFKVSKTHKPFDSWSRNFKVKLQTIAVFYVQCLYLWKMIFFYFGKNKIVVWD